MLCEHLPFTRYDNYGAGEEILFVMVSGSRHLFTAVLSGCCCLLLVAYCPCDLLLAPGHGAPMLCDRAGAAAAAVAMQRVLSTRNHNCASHNQP